MGVDYRTSHSEEWGKRARAREKEAALRSGSHVPKLIRSMLYARSECELALNKVFTVSHYIGFYCLLPLPIPTASQ